MEKNNLEKEVLSVSQFLALVNQTLSYAYPIVNVEGEVSGFKISQNKWVFFDLKDEDSLVSCFMSVYQLKIGLEDGMLVRVLANPNITKWGKFSLTIKNIEPTGEGSLKKSFDILKLKLEKEGLFEPSRKRDLPDYPQKIALITSRQAAAFNDFKKIIDQRWAGLEVDHLQVQVQGEKSPNQIRDAIEYFNQNPAKYDALIVIRGGGSLEDLQAFNHEDVVRSIYASRIVTVVGIGHEDDVSLAELAADIRAATPTDAARIVTNDKSQQIQTIDQLCSYWSKQIEGEINQRIVSIDGMSLVFRELYSSFEEKLESLHRRIKTLFVANLKILDGKLQSLSRIIKNLDPKKILSRGYSIARVRGKIIHSSGEVKAKDTVVLQLHKGELKLLKK